MKQSILLMIALVLFACASDPSRRYVQAREVQATVADSLITLSKAEPPQISIENLKRGRALLQIVDGHLDRFREAIASGKDRDTLTVILDTAMNALTQAQQFIDASGKKLDGEISVRLASIELARKAVA